MGRCAAGVQRPVRENCSARTCAVTPPPSMTAKCFERSHPTSASLHLNAAERAADGPGQPAPIVPTRPRLPAAPAPAAATDVTPPDARCGHRGPRHPAGALAPALAELPSPSRRPLARGSGSCPSSTVDGRRSPQAVRGNLTWSVQFRSLPVVGATRPGRAGWGGEQLRGDFLRAEYSGRVRCHWQFSDMVDQDHGAAQASLRVTADVARPLASRNDDGGRDVTHQGYNSSKGARLGFAYETGSH